MISPKRLNPETDSELLVRISSGLEGIPLALELAAARLKSISLSQVADGLDDQMRLLRAIDRTRPEGVRTMESAVRASYDSLTSEEQRIFRQLCIFPATFSIDLAEHLVEVPELQETLDRLVECSVIFVASSSSDAVRYGMYEVIRQFGESCLKENRALASVQQKFVDVVYAMTKQTSPLIATHQRPEAMAKFALERDNWQRAMQLCSDGTAFAQFVFSLTAYLSVATQGRESAFWLRQILARRDTTAAPLVARAVAGLGIFYWEQCDAENADHYSEEAIALARDQEDRAVLARALNTRGLVLRLIGRYEDAYKMAVEALDLAIELGEQGFATTFRGNVGRCATDCGRYEEALGHLNAVRDTYLERAMPREVATMTYAIAWTHFNAGNTATAIEMFGEALPVFLAENADIYLGWALHNFLLMCLAHEDDQASAHIFGAIRMIERTSQTRIFYSVDGESERKLNEARVRLGEPEWLRIMDTTHDWSLEQAVGYALSWQVQPSKCL